MQVTYDEVADSFMVVTEIGGEDVELSIPLQAFASWSELLGYDDMLDTLEAMLQHSAHPVIDDWTGPNVWTDVYAVLAYREEQREAEFFKAQREGTADDPRSPLLRSTLRAYECLPRDEHGDCVLDQCRRESRQRQGLPEPNSKLSVVRPSLNLEPKKGAVKLSGEPTCDETPHAASDKMMLTSTDRSEARACIADKLTEITRRKALFQHAQTPFEENPIPPAGLATTTNAATVDNRNPEELARERLLGGQS